MEVSGKATDGPVSRYINRRLSTRITGFILNHNIPATPNQISLISFLLGTSSLPAYLAGLEWLGGILVQAASIMDGVDGELARAKNMASPVGGFVDAILDRVANASIILGITLYSFNSWKLWALVAGMLALFGDIMVSYLHARAEASLGMHPSKMGRIPMFASRDVRLFLIFVLSLIGASFYSLWLVAAISLIYVFLKTWEIYLSFRGAR